MFFFNQGNKIKDPSSHDSLQQSQDEKRHLSWLKGDFKAA